MVEQATCATNPSLPPTPCALPLASRPQRPNAATIPIMQTCADDVITLLVAIPAKVPQKRGAARLGTAREPARPTALEAIIGPKPARLLIK